MCTVNAIEEQSIILLVAGNTELSCSAMKQIIHACPACYVLPMFFFIFSFLFFSG